MPKIELYRNSLDHFIGERLDRDALEEQLTVAKGEIDEWEDEDGIVKIELNDTNRPDLWSTAGLGRQLFIYRGGTRRDYGFFSTPERPAECGDRTIQVDPALETTRPYVVGFIASGREIDEATLADMIQTQEKLCWNYGQKRRAIAMGIYRSDLIRFPVQYQAADPDATRFVPLGEDQSEQSLRQIIEHHPKGQEFGHIIADFERMPYLADSAGETLSLPPVINSAKVGAVETGDSRVFIEMTGTDQHLIMLAASIVACDLADAGFTIEPVRTEYPYDTPLGRSVVSPMYFQKPLQVDVQFVSGWLGLAFTPETASAALARMGVSAEPSGDSGLKVYPPAYRNDYLHEVDVAEDIMIGHGMDRFEPEPLHDFTVGRLSRVEEFSREIKSILVGLGYQEFVFNYLGSRRDYRERMTPQPLIPGGRAAQAADAAPGRGASSP
ncbi:MAG: phenylalanine--tRNA ligase subunit beta [bacterium]